MNDIEKIKEIVYRQTGIQPNIVLLSVGVTELLTNKEQFRFPRSRNKRIQKKWANNPRNYRNMSQKKFDSLFWRMCDDKNGGLDPC